MNERLSARDFTTLLAYYRACIEYEDLLSQTFDIEEQGTSFYSNLFTKEQFFYEHLPHIILQKNAKMDHLLSTIHEQQQRQTFYGYPIYVDSSGKICPVFFIELQLNETPEGILCIKKTKTMEINQAFLVLQGLETEEIKHICSDIKSEPVLEKKLEKLADLIPTSHTRFTPMLYTEPLTKPIISTLLNVAIIFSNQRKGINQGLLTELHKLSHTSYSDVKASSLAPLLNHHPRTRHEQHDQKEILEIYPLNPSQTQAVHHALTCPLSVITGPPGTGKSQVVLNIIANAVYHNKTVLFASKNNKAVDVVVNKLNTLLSYPLVVRMGTKNHRQQAKTKIENLFSHHTFPVDTQQLNDNITTLRHLTLTQRSIQPSVQPRHRFFHKQTQKQQHHTQILLPQYDQETQQKKITLSRDIFEKYWLHKLNTKTTAITHFIHQYIDATERLERRIKNPVIWRQLDTDQKRSIEEILPVLPVWVVTNLSAKNSVPFSPHLFDLVIIDEASQCDIASALPLLYRAKHAVIIGDPKQLKHVSLMNESQEETLAAQTKATSLLLEYSFLRHSLYTLVEDKLILTNEQPLLLNMHYRSHPDIIRFSNTFFYNGKLQVATNEKHLFSDPEIPQGIIWKHVTGTTVRAKSPYCIEEADSVIHLLQNLRVKERKNASFGVVTLFRAQMELIIDKINQTPDLQGANIVVGTAHRFQGDEKDIIIFSLAVSQGIRPTTLHWIETTRQLVNVAITRAKSLVVIIGDKHTCSQSKGLLQSLVDYVETQPSSQTKTSSNLLMKY